MAPRHDKILVMPEPLADRWHSRDLPVLIEVARCLDSGARSAVPYQIAQVLPDLELDDVIASFQALDGRYIKAFFQHGDNRILIASATGLTERGLRATGLWPQEDAAADALVELLDQAADSASDEDDAGAIRRAGRALRGVPGSVIADVTAALIRQQAGL